MRSGRLRQVIRIERPDFAPDDLGTPVASWAKVAVVRASVEFAGAEEFLRAQGAVVETAAVFRTRHVAGVTTTDRILVAGRAFGIREVVDHGPRGGLELRAVAAEAPS